MNSPARQRPDRAPAHQEHRGKEVTMKVKAYVAALSILLMVTGAVITIDHYGNLHTNVPGEMLAALS
jgi:S-adenosylmethionine hydrolase